MRRARRCLLFVPGITTSRAATAVKSGADSICFDLEDAILPQHKQKARDEVLSWLQRELPTQHDSTEVVVRINSPRSADGAGCCTIHYRVRALTARGF